ncbi:MAG: nitroreductase family protein [Coriobacteriia bacterium]|nr:nitroreductase family protein [Coriobacteriia bacterium]
MELQQALEQRYSARSFVAEAVPTVQQITAILEAGRLAPTAKNVQSQRVWVVTKPEDLEKIDAATRCRYGAPAVLIVGSDENVAARHNLWGGTDWSFGKDDATSALVHMMLKATDLGLATCWLGAFDDTRVRADFAIPENVAIHALLDLGTPDAENGGPSPRHTSRVPLEETVTWL